VPFRLVAQCFDQLRYHVAHFYYYYAFSFDALDLNLLGISSTNLMPAKKFLFLVFNKHIVMHANKRISGEVIVGKLVLLL
jgi:hypothetical protein